MGSKNLKQNWKKKMDKTGHIVFNLLKKKNLNISDSATR